jgi:hypothetical protein
MRDVAGYLIWSGSTFRPGAAVPAGQSVTLYRDELPMPEGLAECADVAVAIQTPQHTDYCCGQQVLDL